MSIDPLTFAEALAHAGAAAETPARAAKPTILLGNGFSIDYDARIFTYDSLWAKSEFPGMTLSKSQLEEVIGTYDFETAIRRIERAATLVRLYAPGSDAPEKLRSDAHVVRRALSGALTALHPGHANDLSEARRRHVREFFSHFAAIFTTNYDLLTYWAVTGAQDDLPVPRTDGFGKVDGLLTWSPERQQRVSFLHGALHLLPGAVLTKAYGEYGKPMLQHIREWLSADRRPLMVTEGTTEEKLERILQSDYLRRCLDLLRTTTGPLFIHGFSLSKNDAHLLDVISAPESGITSLYVSVHGDGLAVRERARELAQRRARMNPAAPKLRVSFYDADSAHVWE
ncbi:DUF4917 family protein [Leucobacter luti]|uniref:Uncharacterized protein DUF4917 n=1 Tax=Leucobacter luti TaxID=340320 RepID=A0A4Q7TVP4_9MICO|nr:DUF4917 family protein [Leucobacter luti]MBL3698123.1 DUF4917 family protein [Leucobacter luti]RZT64793.1 uncharacterized protein DUF4917 [Leucobacter luti]